MNDIQASDYFAIIPEWLLDAPISSNAVRLYAILNRYANSQGRAWPSRKTIATAMKCSTATVDRARDELVAVGALTVIQRTSDAGDPTSNLYVLHIRPVETVEGSSPVPKGLLTDDHTGIPTDDDLNRDSMNESQSGTSSPAKCSRCHGTRVILGNSYEENGYRYTVPPMKCPECQP